MKHEPESEARRWLLQAKHDLDDADFRNIKKRASTLDTYYIPTRYPNGLPGGIPSEAYQKEDAQRALSICNEVIDMVEKKIGKVNIAHR